MRNTVALFILVLVSNSSLALDLDAKLDLVKQVYKLSAKTCDSPHVTKEEIAAGKLIFESKALAGNRDTSCSTCHVDRFGSADGLPLAIGVGGDGEGEQRLAHGKGVLVQRNALSMIGRGNGGFSAFFWDGRVQEQDGRVISPFGEHLSPVFKSALAVAAVLPFLERDEFIGKRSLLVRNEIEAVVEDKLYQRRYVAVSGAIRERLLNPSNEDDRALGEALRSTGVDLERFELAHVGNLIAIHIGTKFKCKESRWDQYLKGNSRALSVKEKEGALLFYGKGRCAACHVGSLFSDFDFHSIGTPQGGFGPHSRHRDIGRAHVTTRAEDLYKFRTPPLIQVSETAPYGHNGAFRSLQEVVVHHFNPLEFYIKRPDFASADYFEVGKIINARDDVLGSIEIGRDEELGALIAFLEVL